MIPNFVDKKKKKILVSGCSYTEQKTWPNRLANTEPLVKNLAVSGAGNSYISNSIMSAINWKPDFVFVLWTGINRIELRTPNSKIFKTSDKQDRKIELDNSIYWPSGGALNLEHGWLAAYNNMREPEWPGVTKVADWLTLPLDIKQKCIEERVQLTLQDETISAFVNNYYVTQYLEMDRAYYSELTFQNMLNCFNLLDKLNIPYRFSFIYDIWSKNHHYSLGQAVKEHYYHLIDWSRYIDLTPYEYGIKHNLLDKDDFHLTEQGMNQWADEIAKILQDQPDLNNLLN